MGGSGESISLSRRKTNSDSEKNDDCCNQENNLKTTKQVNHGSARNTSLETSRCRHIRGTKLERTGPWQFPQGSRMFSFRDEYLGFYHRNVSAFGRSQPIPQSSWVRLRSFLGVICRVIPGGLRQPGEGAPTGT